MQVLWVFVIVFSFSASFLGKLNAQYTLPIEKQIQGLLKQNKTTEARESLLKYYQHNPRSYHAPYTLYRYAQLSQNPEEFINTLKKIVQDYSNFPELDEVLMNLGDLFFLKEKFSESLFYYKRLLKFFSKSPLRAKALYSIARIYFQQRNPKELHNILHTLRLESHKIGYPESILVFLAKLDIQEGRKPKGFSPKNPTKKPNKKIENGTEERIIGEGEESILYGLAEFHFQSGNRSLAKKYFRKILKERPNTPEAFLSKHRLSAKNYYLQLAVFQNSNNAKQFLRKVKDTLTSQKILSTFIQNLYLYSEKEEKIFKIILGPIQNRKDLELLKRNLSQIGFLVLSKAPEKK